MTDDRWRNVAELFEAVVDLPADERAAALERHCAGDDELRRRVERLLAADASADEVLSPFAPLLDAALPAGALADPLGLTGTQIHQYTVESCLGAGGMGIVYRARDDRLGRAVALKFLPPEYSRDHSARERLLREARAASALDHPNICTVHEVGSTPDGRLYIAMSLYDGDTLAERLARGPMPLAEVLDLGAQVARGLAHAHDHGVIHRDIKPPNLLLTRDGTVKILDFGVARSELMTATQPHLRAGTAYYMSPEQVSGEPVDKRTDLWSLGVVLHELITGERPFRGADPLSVMLAIRTGEAAPLAALRPDVPVALEQLVGRLLSREPGGRPAGAREVEQELAALRGLTPDGPGGRRMRSHGKPSRSRSRRVPLVVVSAAVITAVVAAAAGLLPERSLRARGLFDVRERIVVADFATQTGDSLLAAAVSEALRVDLDRSPAVQVVDRSYLNEVLARMALDPQTPVRGPIAREIALRDGVKAYVEGEVSAAGRGVVLVVRLVGSADGTPLVALRETARDSSGVIPAVDRLSRALRRRIGEPLRSVRASDPLERITTQSLHALQLYARGSEAYHVRGDPTTARDLLLEAIRFDTAFAMAYRKLGIVAFTDQETRVRALERAFAFRDRLPAVERDFITGTYHAQLTFDPTQAFRAYRRLLEVDPDNWMAANNLGIVHGNVGELDHAEAIFRSLPDDYNTKFNNLHMVLLRQGRVAAADSVIRLGTELLPDHMFVAGARLMFLVHAGRAHEADSLLALWDARPMAPGQRSVYLYGAGFAQALRGRLRVGDRMIAESQPLALRVASEETWAFAIEARSRVATLVRNDPDRAVQLLDAALADRPLESLPRFDRPYLGLAIAYAEAGRPETAAELVAAWEREIPPGLRGSPENRIVAGGYIALARGRPREAIDTLRLLERLPMRQCQLCGLYPLGLAWERLGEPDSAIAAYAAFVDYPVRGFAHDNLATPAALLRLGELLEARGDTARALEYFGQVIQLWDDADPELQPRLAAARRRITEPRTIPR